MYSCIVRVHIVSASNLDYTSFTGEDEECYDTVVKGASGHYATVDCAGLVFTFRENCCELDSPEFGVCNVCSPGQVVINP
jgi:hypothetical protein